MKPLTCDAHVDTLWVLSGYALQEDPTVTLERCQFGGLDRLTLVLYVSDHWQEKLGDGFTWEAIGSQITMANVEFPGQFIALEGGRCLGLEEATIHRRLKQLADAGIKYLTLVHNTNNQFCSSATGNYDGGLTQEGRDLIEELEDYGILVDVSHSSDRTVAEVLAFSTSRPIIASHSGCRAILPHVRNLTDSQIIQLALTGGVVGIPFARRFVGTIDAVAQHVDHVCQLTGSVSHVGIGSDLDGAVMVDGVKGAEDWSTVVIDGLAKRGYSDEHIAQVAGGNLLRLFTS